MFWFIITSSIIQLEVVQRVEVVEFGGSELRLFDEILEDFCFTGIAAFKQSGQVGFEFSEAGVHKFGVEGSNETLLRESLEVLD